MQIPGRIGGRGAPFNCRRGPLALISADYHRPRPAQEFTRTPRKKEQPRERPGMRGPPRGRGPAGGGSSPGPAHNKQTPPRNLFSYVRGARARSPGDRAAAAPSPRALPPGPWPFPEKLRGRAASAGFIGAPFRARPFCARGGPFARALLGTRRRAFACGGPLPRAPVN